MGCADRAPPKQKQPDRALVLDVAMWFADEGQLAALSRNAPALAVV